MSAINWITGKEKVVNKEDSVEPTFSALEHMYSSMVGGSFKVPASSDPERTAYWLAREALDTEGVALKVGVEDGHAYYLAVPSRVASNLGKVNTPLCAAIPGNPGYKGDGAYVIRFAQNNFAVVAMRSGATIRVLANELDPIYEAIEDAGLTIIDCTEAQAEPLRSLSLIAEESAYRGGWWIAHVAGWAFLVSAVIFIASNFFEGLSVSRVNETLKTREMQVQEIVSQLVVASPLSERMAAMNRVTSVVTRAGGWVKLYRNESDGEKFVIEMPEWVSKDYLDALGAGIKVDHDRVRQVLVVTKGKVDEVR